MGGSVVESAFRAGSDDPDLRLIETVLWDGTHCPLLEAHLSRLAWGAAALGWPCDLAAARRALTGPAGQGARLRLTLDRAGGLSLQSGPLPAAAAEWRLGLAAARLDADDPWLRLKTTRRAAYDAARAALAPGLDEVVFLNQHGQVCDGSITTLFFDRGQGLRTPPLGCGLLPGVLRGTMLARGQCHEEILLAEDLPRVRLWVGNALRGLIPAQWHGC